MIVMRNKSHGENMSLYGNNSDRSWKVKIHQFQEKYLTLLPKSIAYCLTANHVEKKPV